VGRGWLGRGFLRGSYLEGDGGEMGCPNVLCLWFGAVGRRVKWNFFKDFSSGGGCSLFEVVKWGGWQLFWRGVKRGALGAVVDKNPVCFYLGWGKLGCLFGVVWWARKSGGVLFCFCFGALRLFQ